MGTVVEQKGEQGKKREMDRGSARRDQQGVMSFGLEIVLRNSYSPQNSVLPGQLRAGLVSSEVSRMKIEWPHASPAIAQTQGMHVPAIQEAGGGREVSMAAVGRTGSGRIAGSGPRLL